MYRARRTGRRLLGPAFDHILFTRPRQWPILSAQFLISMLAAPAAAALLGSGGPGEPPASGAPFDWGGALLAWAAWVLCLNGGTLAFNSAFDADTESIAYLDDPPPPPRGLVRSSLILMLLGIPAAWVVAPSFALVTGICVLLSILYSHPRVRLKGTPGCDLLTNMVGYGGGTTLAGLLAGQAVAGGEVGIPAPEGWFLAAGFALLFGSFYPLTQFYQIDADRERGDRTLASALGERRSLSLAILLGVAAAYFLIAAAQIWNPQESMGSVLPLLAGVVIWNLLLGSWRRRLPAMDAAGHERWMYRALAVWALIDVGVVAARLGRLWT